MGDQPTVTMTPVAMGRPHRVNQWFYISVALLLILFNVIAFAPSIIDRSKRNVPLPLTPLVSVHAVLSVVWLLIFLMQTILVATGRTVIHRRVGMIGALVTVAFVAVGSFTVIAQARRGFDLSGDLSRLPPPPGADPVAAVAGQLFFLLTFAILFGAAVWYRHRPNVHKRLMLLAVLGGLTPTGGTCGRALVRSPAVDRCNRSRQPTHPSIIERNPRSRLERPHSSRVAVVCDSDVPVDRRIQRCDRAEFGVARLCDRAESVTDESGLERLVSLPRRVSQSSALALWVATVSTPE
jgi:hypothetical protein